MLHPVGFWHEAASSTTYALSGETGITSNVSFGSTAKAGIRINADGTIDKLVTAAYTQIDSATDWIIPNGADKSACRFRCTNSGDSLAPGADSTASWLSAPCEWWVEEIAAEGSKSLNISVEISIDTGSSTHDTGVYSGSANVGPLF